MSLERNGFWNNRFLIAEVYLTSMEVRMSRHGPVISGRQLVRALQSTGFLVLRQKGRPA